MSMSKQEKFKNCYSTKNSRTEGFLYSMIIWQLFQVYIPKGYFPLDVVFIPENKIQVSWGVQATFDP